MTNDLPTLPSPTPTSPESVTPPRSEAAPPADAPAPPPTEEAPTATGEGVPAAESAPPPGEPPVATSAPEPAPEEPEAPEPTPEEPPPPSNKHWYVVKVQSGREESIKEAIERRVKIEGLEEYYGQILIPVEKVVEMRSGKRVTRERKLYPGYLMAEVEYNDRILYLFRETSGVGDFVGAGVNRAPTPMTPPEVARMRRKSGDEKGIDEAKEIHGKPPVDRGDRVKVKDGMFAGMEGEVKDIFEAKNQVKVELTVFGRPVNVEFEYWQVEPV